MEDSRPAVFLSRGDERGAQACAELARATTARNFVSMEADRGFVCATEARGNRLGKMGELPAGSESVTLAGALAPGPRAAPAGPA